MHDVLANAFFEEIFSLEMQKYAFDLDPDQFDRITSAIGQRWAKAGIDPATVTDRMADLRSQLADVATAGGTPGSASYRGAQERARDLARRYSAFAPGTKVVPHGRLDELFRRGSLVYNDKDPYEARRPGAERPGANAESSKSMVRYDVSGDPVRSFKRVQQKKPQQGTAIGRSIRNRLGIIGDTQYVGDKQLLDTTEALADVTPKQLARRGDQLIGLEALKDLKAGTGKGIADAARKTLLPGIKALPASAKALGAGAALLGVQKLFGDKPKTTITVG